MKTILMLGLLALSASAAVAADMPAANTGNAAPTVDRTIPVPPLPLPPREVDFRCEFWKHTKHGKVSCEVRGEVCMAFSEGRHVACVDRTDGDRENWMRITCTDGYDERSRAFATFDDESLVISSHRHHRGHMDREDEGRWDNDHRKHHGDRIIIDDFRDGTDDGLHAILKRHDAGKSKRFFGRCEFQLDRR